MYLSRRARRPLFSIMEHTKEASMVFKNCTCFSFVQLLGTRDSINCFSASFKESWVWSVGLFRFWEVFNDLVYKTIGNVLSLYIESSMVCDMSKLHEEDITIRKSLLVCLHALASHF